MIRHILKIFQPFTSLTPFGTLCINGLKKQVNFNASIYLQILNVSILFQYSLVFLRAPSNQMKNSWYCLLVILWVVYWYLSWKKLKPDLDNSRYKRAWALGGDIHVELQVEYSWSLPWAFSLNLQKIKPSQWNSKYCIQHFSRTKNWKWSNMYNYVKKAIYYKIYLWYGITQDLANIQSSQ